MAVEPEALSLEKYEEGARLEAARAELQRHLRRHGKITMKDIKKMQRVLRDLADNVKKLNKEYDQIRDAGSEGKVDQEALIKAWNDYRIADKKYENHWQRYQEMLDNYMNQRKLMTDTELDKELKDDPNWHPLLLPY